MNDQPGQPLRELPALDSLLRDPSVIPLVGRHGRAAVASWARTALDAQRARLISSGLSHSRAELVSEALTAISENAVAAHLSSLRRVINATGVVLHTNLGRAPLADAAVAAVAEAARYASVELDLASGKRLYRGYQLDARWRDLSGAEAGFAVNNCAGATLLALAGLAAGKEVVVSRGELIEIGGAFRLPDIFRLSGAILCEVGTTNRTRLSDYRKALTSQTGALLLVHPSNYRQIGFVESVALADLVSLGREHGVPVIHDVGSGAMFDLAPYGLPGEPVVSESVRAGADLVLFSGDKLLGGPQCGVLVGRKVLVERLRESPMARALRVDKLTLAALQATLQIYAAGDPLRDIPALRMLVETVSAIRSRAERFRLDTALPLVPLDGFSAVGGGALPGIALPTALLRIEPTGRSADALAERMRRAPVPALGRIENDAVLLDFRTVLPGEESSLAATLRCALEGV